MNIFNHILNHFCTSRLSAINFAGQKIQNASWKIILLILSFKMISKKQYFCAKNDHKLAKFRLNFFGKSLLYFEAIGNQFCRSKNIECELENNFIKTPINWLNFNHIFFLYQFWTFRLSGIDSAGQKTQNASQKIILLNLNFQIISKKRYFLAKNGLKVAKFRINR